MKFWSFENTITIGPYFGQKSIFFGSVKGQVGSNGSPVHSLAVIRQLQVHSGPKQTTILGIVKFGGFFSFSQIAENFNKIGKNGEGSKNVPWSQPDHLGVKIFIFEIEVFFKLAESPKCVFPHFSHSAKFFWHCYMPIERVSLDGSKMVCNIFLLQTRPKL